MSGKTARSSALTVIVNAAPSSGPMTFQPHPDGFGGPVARHAIVPLWREPATRTNYSVTQVRCASPAAAAQATTCFLADP